MGVRRVVTGHSPEGKAIVASDEIVEPITLDMLPGYEFVRLWAADEAATLPGDGAVTSAGRLLPSGRRLPLRSLHRAAGDGAGAG